jgi:hypothetical protein
LITKNAYKGVLNEVVPIPCQKKNEKRKVILQ